MANKYFYEKYRLRTNDFDTLDHIYMSSILDFCQDVAGEHANDLKVGFKDLYKDNKIWMVLRTKIKAIDYPPTLSSVLVKTWPLAPNRVDMDRNYLITSIDEEKTYFKVVSKWIVCNISDRRLVRAKDVHFDIDSYSDEILFDEPFDKLSFILFKLCSHKAPISIMVLFNIFNCSSNLLLILSKPSCNIVFCSLVLWFCKHSFCIRIFN